MRILVLGAGFAGSILARVLRVQGHTVTLVDRERHPRFAIGESSTPLAALSLERLARRYGLSDLAALAAWGRWRRELPELRHGLKRGFTFYGHRHGEAWGNDEENRSRLLVAASPENEIADVHWLRADVDAHLAERARTEGVDLRQATTVEQLARIRGGWHCRLRSGNTSEPFAADLVLDATGAGGVLGRTRGLAEAPHRSLPATLLVGGHFSGVGDFVAKARARGVPLPAGPYPDERAAVHHLLDEGWLYALAFDHGVVSAGFVLRHDRVDGGLRRLAAENPGGAWRELLDRYPSLAEQFADARSEPPGVFHVDRLQRRWSRAAGSGWAMLPFAYCFWSPLYSTGIAWSLLGIERLAGRLEPFASHRRRPLPPRHFERYARALAAESEHFGDLLAVAYRLTPYPARFFSWSLLYFAAASFSEAEQRLLPAPAGGWAWGRRGFLGAGDRTQRAALAKLARSATRSPTSAAADERFAAAVRAAIEPRDVAGLSLEERRNLYPVEPGPLLDGAGRLGLTRQELEHRMPRLRWAGARALPSPP